MPRRPLSGAPLVNAARAGALLVATLLLLLGSGCGLKTDPRPLSRVLRPTDGVRAWQRDNDVVVSWLWPDSGSIKRFGDVEGFDLWLQTRPLYCLDCSESGPDRIEVDADDAELIRQGGLAYYIIPFNPDNGRMRIRVTTRFDVGTTPLSGSVVVERASTIPTPSLRWRWAVDSVPADSGARSVHLFWEAPRERIVHVVTEHSRPTERVQRFRANVYRRIPPEPWPLQSLNGQPLHEMDWVVPPLQGAFPANAEGEAFLLRYVDQFGNEGPPSAEILVPLAGRKP